jgi:hypothetical protein
MLFKSKSRSMMIYFLTGDILIFMVLRVKEILATKYVVSCQCLPNCLKLNVTKTGLKKDPLTHK